MVFPRRYESQARICSLYLKGPRVYDGTGLPLHHDDRSIIKERIYLDKADKNVLHDITVIDNALTRPWSVSKKASRDPDPGPIWRSAVCADRDRQAGFL